MIVYSHEIVCRDRRIFPLTPQDANRLNTAMQNRDTFFQLDANTLLNIPADIARVQKRKVTEADRIPPPHQITSGERKGIDKNGPGYKKFVAARNKLAKKMSMKGK